MFGSISHQDHSITLDSSQLIRRRLRLIFSLVFVVALVVGSAMAYIMRAGNNLALIHSRHVEAVNQIQLQTTFAHLWFEEILSGDKSESIEDVWLYYARAHEQALAMLEGAETPLGTIAPVRDVQLRKQLNDVLEHLESFEAAARQRFEAGSRASAGSDIDQEFDDFFEHFMVHANNLNDYLHSRIRVELRNFRVVQSAMVVFFFRLGFALALGFGVAFFLAFGFGFRAE